MKKYFFLYATVFFINSVAYTQTNETGTNRGRVTMDTYNNTVQRGWAGYLGASAGYTGYNTNLEVEGTPTALKLIGSYVTEGTSGVFDIGYGIQNQTFSQDSAQDSAISTGVMELAARYQFENRWQLGAVYNQFFEKGASYSANQSDAEFGGVQILREFSFGGNYLGRVGGRILTSLNINNESVSMAIIDFQIGWGGSNYSNSSMHSLNN